MGIRVHKVIGYGLCDVELDRGKIIDDRFYEQSAFMMEEERNQIDGEHYESPEDVYTKEGFVKYLQSHLDRPYIDVHMINRLKKWDFYRCFIREWEGPLNNVFIVIPPGHSDWYRFDNIIDYIEEGMGRNGDHLEKLQQGIWPYSSVHQNEKGERLNPMDSCRWWRYYNDILDGNVDQERVQGMNIVMHCASLLMGFNDFHDARDNIAPYVPDMLKAFCHYTNIFNDPDTVNQLRPMMFTYWS